MKVRRGEAEFARRCLDALAAKGAAPEQVDDARGVLDSLKLHDHE